MIELVHHKKLSTDQISDMCRGATAIIGLCKASAWSIQNGNEREIAQLADDTQHALKVARSLLETVQDRLDANDGGAS